MHKVIMHLDVLCVSMEHRVLGKLYAIDVVAVDRDRESVLRFVGLAATAEAIWLHRSQR